VAISSRPWSLTGTRRDSVLGRARPKRLTRGVLSGPFLPLRRDERSFHRLEGLFSRGCGNVGIAFAVPIDTAKSELSTLDKNGTVIGGFR
jgi:hypothetical protein